MLSTILFVVLMCTILLVSVILNTMVCYTILGWYKKIDITHLFLLNISVCDILQTVIGLVPEIFFTFNSKYVMSTGNEGLLCVISGALTFAFATTVMTHMTMLTILRTVAVTFPFFYNATFNIPWVKFSLLAACYIYGFVWALLPLIGWSTYHPDIDHKRCSLDWSLTKPNTFSYIICVNIFCYIFPLTLTSGFLFFNNKKMKRKRGKRRRTSCVSNTADIEILERGFVQLILFSVIMFAVFWTPYAVIGLTAVCGYKLPSYMMTTAAIFAKLSAVINPVVNCLRNRSFVRCLLKISIFKTLCSFTKKRNVLEMSTSCVSEKLENEEFM